MTSSWGDYECKILIYRFIIFRQLGSINMVPTLRFFFGCHNHHPGCIPDFGWLLGSQQKMDMGHKKKTWPGFAVIWNMCLGFNKKQYATRSSHPMHFLPFILLGNSNIRTKTLPFSWNKRVICMPSSLNSEGCCAFVSQNICMWGIGVGRA